MSDTPHPNRDFKPIFMERIENHSFSEFLDLVIRQVDEIVEINPDLSEREIFEEATHYMINNLGAHSASVRIYDPQTEQMLSYGSYPSEEYTRETYIPLEGSIAGKVVATGKTCLVPNILNEPGYQNKNIILKKGVNSLMAIPLEIPRFFPRERDTVGVIQIYYEEKDREFSSLEIQLANLMAKRLSFVVARKKILSLNKNNKKKEAIVWHIFRKLGSRGGIKMREAFNQVIPELADMVSLQSCAFFSVSENLNQIVLEAGYPDKRGYHGIGTSFQVSSEPAFELILNLRDYSGDSRYEVVTPSYVLVVDPQRSDLISRNLKRFAEMHNINSILYVPLKIYGEVSHIMTFDAIEQRQRYSDDEIDTLLFLGHELMKVQKMERLDDALHDFKNPAIAIAGFARRLRQLLENKGSEQSEEQIMKYADILVQETSRIQELALSIYRVGDEQVVNLTDVLKRRFEINKEAIKEQLKQNITLVEGPFDTNLKVKCYLIHLERVFDNLLNNATKAIPLKGGLLEIRTYADGEWACVEISNTGHVSEEDRLNILEGEGPGRGFYIIHRIIRLLKGKIDIRENKGAVTTFLVRLPIA
ncbi:ATPase/histidine kinase/DNA gyrase B/HSP90 domain protein [uncultured Desulfobacterium sp.]|uniref:ATPase/histidine kinase/DNA gyrase B/HSP90 domain protein n=1 Tax=uncultured Desulfobacterium sp. TaxID=201089 RepID=A0A445MTA9_9BACT|nr:ATPase/histidine kinase/DNA gyrase B/HSP90 domain protein [uncultured Desulfobacterium sp.]